MIKKTILKNGKKYIVNVPGWADEGIGPGFPIGKMVFKSTTTKQWYVVMASGSLATASVSQSALSFPTTSYYDINYPYQLLYSPNNGNSYYVYLSGSATSASLVVSQSAYTGSETPKPALYLENITNGKFYSLSLSSSTTGVSLYINQTPVSASSLSF